MRPVCKKVNREGGALAERERLVSQRERLEAERANCMVVSAGELRSVVVPSVPGPGTGYLLLGKAKPPCTTHPQAQEREGVG